MRVTKSCEREQTQARERGTTQTKTREHAITHTQTPHSTPHPASRNPNYDGIASSSCPATLPHRPRHPLHPRPHCTVRSSCSSRRSVRRKPRSSPVSPQRQTAQVECDGSSFRPSWPFSLRVRWAQRGVGQGLTLHSSRAALHISIRGSQNEAEDWVTQL